ncbi:MAG: hypothetical protein ACOH18_04000 [Candidatus Saccharimonadaceae bacterium]
MELSRFPSYRVFSIRSIVTFVLTVVITALLWTTLASTTSGALGLDETTANWQGSGSTLLYSGHGYNLASNFSDPTGTVPADATAYQSAVQTSGSSSVSKKIFILYFSSGVDPPTATSAKYVEFDYKNSIVSNPQNQRDINVTPQEPNGNSGSSCNVSGIGYIICPTSEFLADAMDSMFGVLAGLIAVQPSVFGDNNSSMYIAWNIMRSISNVAFVIVFLIIIYSQLTNIAISNYGLKKLLPRLIIAAILVNMSYLIAALAIDISNVLGYSIQDAFNAIREQTFHLTNDDISGFNTNNWGSVTAAVLAGGGLVGGVFFAAGGGLYLLLPILLGVLLTIIFVVIILAARQAIVVIMVIIAPLAFVANLLPNTEKWFDKWKDLFFTMLIFFPAFSLVFGGSQLAGQIIIQNAGDNIVTLIFGMAVQIAPLVITPLILKLSGGLLGRIAQIANNPRKGVIDRNRNWAQNRAEHAKQQNIARGPRLKNPTSWGAGMVRNSDFRKRRLSDSTDIWKQEATNRYEKTPGYGGIEGNERSIERSINGRKAAAELDKEGIHNEHAGHIERLKLTQGTRIHDAAMTVQTSKDGLETQQQHVAGYYNMLRTVGGTELNTSNNALEAAKGNASASEQNKEAYLNQMRTFRSTQLGAAAERLESAKLNAEGMQNTYTTHMDTLKLRQNTPISNAAIFAQSSKEHSEAAQGRVQAMFDNDRNIEGTQLNASMINLEGSKLEAETAKNVTTRYVSDAKSNINGALHVQNMKLEKAKSKTQVGEAELKRIVEEYRSGKITPTTPELTDVMDSMVYDVEQLAAENRGVQAAQNIQQRNVNEALTQLVDVTNSAGTVIGTTESARATELLDIAASVDPNGRIRAKAAATSQLGKIEREALDNNVILLDEQAEAQGVNDIAWARSILQRQLGTIDPQTGQRINQVQQDPGLLEAAVEKLTRDGDIGTVRSAMMEKLGGLGDEEKNKAIMNRVIARNAGVLKVKGGFDIQQKISGLWGASRETMDQSIAFSLGAVTAENISGQKWGWWHSYAEKGPDGRTGLERIVDNVEAMPEGRDKQDTKRMLRSFYANLSTALTSPEIMTKIGDRNDDTADMHEILHTRAGLIDKKVTIDYDLARGGIATPPPRPPQP